FTQPLLIGGATTSRTHTALKIAPQYENGVTVYVPDASRAASVVSRLLSAEKIKVAREIADEYQALREAHAARSQGTRLVTLEEARANAFVLDATRIPPAPKLPGLHEIRFDLAQIAELIDWTPFFHSWDLRGRYPAILTSADAGKAASQLYADAQNMLEVLIREAWLDAKGVFALLPASRAGDDIVFYRDATRAQIEGRIVGLRQQHAQPSGRRNLALADFVAEQDDWAGLFAVTAGLGIERQLAVFAANQDDYNAILLKALADRLVEAAAEWLHRAVRTHYWGYAPEEKLDGEALIRESFVGIRPAPGYPACPDHLGKREIFRLLDVTRRIGMGLTETCAMTPAASVAGFYFARPEACYFAIPKIGQDQLSDWATRHQMPEAEAKKWLANLL
ncbi:MAG: methionine synthase, partial [Zoogloeaceae bacterium]|nr:methionine synthase [Zoogloeaceae bacterium]